MSYLVPYFSSDISKECTDPGRFYTSLDSKNSLVLKQMEGTAIKMPGKRLILPKVSSTSKDSMSLKNIRNPEISKRCLNNSKGKVILRIADPGASNSAKKSLPTKPKNFTSQVQDITNQQIVIVDANNISQSQIADAESNNSAPARNPLTYKFVVANDFIDAEKAIADETNCTNTETDTIDYYTDKDSHQGLNQQPGRQLMNSNPFLSDFNSLELINDIDSFNTVSTQEDPEKDKVIAEAYIPVVDNKKPNMDDDIFFSWGAESLMNCDVPMSDDPMNPMTMVNPVEVEGRNFSADERESENSTNSSTMTENHPASMQEAAGDEVVTEKEMDDIVKNLDDEFIASILQDIEITNDASTNLNDTPAVEETDLLKMVMDDSIGTETMAQFYSSQPDCLTVNLLDINVPNDSKVAQLTSVGESEEEPASVETTTVATTPARRGPGRPRKARTERVVRPRGRPARVHTSSENTSEHHNYSNDSSSMSTAERRYRRMRDLNNIASQRCRLKRKSKMQNAIDELKLSEEKNTELKMKVRILEEQVKTLKKHFIDKISNPAKKVIVVPSPDTIWNAEQFESFVNDTVSQHLDEN